MTFNETILKVVEEFRAVPYGTALTEEQRDEGLVEGATRTIMWNGSQILREGNRISCVYATVEATVEALRRLGFEGRIPVEDVRLFKKAAFIPEEDLDEYFEGIGGAVVTLGWGSDVAEEDIEPGDLIQIWDYHVDMDKYVFGHSLIAVSEVFEREGADVIETFSAERDGGGRGTKKAGGIKSYLANNWRNIEHPSASKERSYFVGRIDIEKLSQKYPS